MSQVITNAFEQYWQSSLAAEQPVVLDEFVLADIPNLDITAPIDPDTGLPPESQIMHRQNVDQRGRINNNAVAYTIVMDTTVGDFSFNAMYLRNKANGVIGMIVYKGRETKLKTDQTTGQTGNSLVKSMLMGYDQAAEATLTNVDAGTWQIDYAARLRGQDEDLRQLASQLYGHHTFIGDGFKVVQQDGGHQVTQGVAIVGGLRIELKQPQVIYPGTKPIGVWVDVHRSGSLLSEHQNHVTIITSVADLTDHVDGNGYQHYVAKLGTVQADSTVIDGRGQGGSGGSGAIPDTFVLWKRSMAEAGYDLIGEFGTSVTITTEKQVMLDRDTSQVFSWAGYLPRNVGSNEKPAQSASWVMETEKGLRRDLSSPGGSNLMSFSLPGYEEHAVSVGSLLGTNVTAEMFGAKGGGSQFNTLPIQLAIDFVYASGGGVVYLGPKVYKIAASSLNETFDNFGVAIPASTCGIVLRKGVSLICVKGHTKLICDDATISIIALIAPNNNHLSGFELQGGFTGNQGAGHGIVQFGTQGGVDTACTNTTISDVYVHNVGSYGVSFGNGNPTNVHLERIRTDFTGADGLDLKARGDASLPPDSNSATNIVTSRQGMRVEGSAGIDVRGVWHLKNITAKDFGGNPERSYTGIRFRTKPPVTDPYIKAAAKSTLDGFTIYTKPGIAAASLVGIECGSDDVHIAKGTVDDVHQGVAHNGNAVGAANRSTVTGVTTTNCTIYGFRNLVGNDGITYIGCTDVGSATPFRMEGTNMRMIGCTGASISVASSASPSFSQVGCSFGQSTVSVEGINASNTSVSAKGTAADIALRLVPKGTGHIGAFGDVRPDVANTRYLGSNSLPFAGGFIQTAFSVTSDERCKTVPKPITDEMLDAWAEVEYVEYQYLDRVAKKGESVARWHVGAIAQRVIEAFERHDLDAFKYGIVCYNVWDEIPAVIDRETGEIIEMGREAGDRFSLVYEEALVLEAKLQRRNYLRLLARIEALEAS
ncbi:phage tail protein [Aeromonas sp. MR16]|uniref:phage tail-collar fiber domain-containing protein n=1 Tax=Aeromonas sp. MR16 TaxID=2923420 RepID=UPI001F4A106E|nr:phage tail protein [Aeromonas sp. MR16]MCH7372819.1 phage tail protein [Aeromonas sp. MR16]